MAGWTLAGFFLAGQLPVFAALLLAVAGLPALLVVLAWGGSWFVLYGALTLGFTSLFGGFWSALLLIPMVFFPAGLLSWSIKAGFPPMKALAISLVAASLFSLTFWSISPVFGDGGARLWAMKSHLQKVGGMIDNQIREARKADATASASSNLDLLQDQIRAWFDFMILLVPTTLIFSWHLISLAIFYLGALVLSPRFGFSLSPLPKFSTWRFDWNLIWLFLGGWLLYFGSEIFEPIGLREAAKIVGANCLAISNILYFILGFSLLFFFFDVYQITPPNRIGLSVIAVLFSKLLVWLGIIDIWLEFRAPKKQSKNKDESDEDSSFFDNF